MGFDGWPLKGLPFLEIEQGEVQGKVPPRCPALLECGAGMAGQSELSPHLGCSVCRWHHQLPVSQNWSTLLEGHAPRSSNRVQLLLHEGRKGEMKEMEGSWGVPLCHYLVGTDKSAQSILTWHLLRKKLFVGTGYLGCFSWVFL